MARHPEVPAGESGRAGLGGNRTPAPELIAATRNCLPSDHVESEIAEIGVAHNTVVHPSDPDFLR